MQAPWRHDRNLIKYCAAKGGSEQKGTNLVREREGYAQPKTVVLRIAFIRIIIVVERPQNSIWITYEYDGLQEWGQLSSSLRAWSIALNRSYSSINRTIEPKFQTSLSNPTIARKCFRTLAQAEAFIARIELIIGCA